MKSPQKQSDPHSVFAPFEKKGNPYLPILFAVGLFLLCASALLAYQNIGLRQQLEKMNQDLQKAITPTPVAYMNSNDIKDWKTFVDEGATFTILYPGPWTLVTNTINNNLDKNSSLQESDIVYFTEKDFDTGASYNYGRLHILKLGTTQETDVEKWFDTFYQIASANAPAEVVPAKQSIIYSFNKVPILSTTPLSNTQKYLFIIDGNVYGIDVKYADDKEGVDSPQNTALRTIYNRMLTSIAPVKEDTSN
jgi:hypothetical protein